jgi:myo-inositol-1(or 4)-monophosphatase
MRHEDLLQICRKIKQDIRNAISKVPLSELKSSIGMGKDGTPTKKVDWIAEEIAISILKDYNFRIITEESGVVGDGDVFLALDPVDGTFNATRGIPIYSVSLCFSKSDTLKDVFFAYVSNLATGTEYYAEGSWNYGKAFRDGERVNVSDYSEIDCNAIFYYPDREYGFKRVRIFGSAATELCFVADGSVDCFIDIRKGNLNGREGMLRVYDVAAGLFIAVCAGARATDMHGQHLHDKRISMEERFTLVVANSNLHNKLIKLLKSCRRVK